jgi:peptidoglycan L-alanyl-D-glutamate endopeptidase CwlK
MRDKVSIARVAQLHPAVSLDVPLIIDEVEAGWPEWIAVRVVQGLRTFDEQQKLYDQGRITPGKIVTNAMPGSSFHQYGLAIDYALLYDKDKNGKFEELSWNVTKDADADKIADWAEVSRIFIKQGWEWGGNWRTFKDLPHVQKSFGYTWKQLLEKYRAKEFIEGTQYVKL